MKKWLNLIWFSLALLVTVFALSQLAPNHDENNSYPLKIKIATSQAGEGNNRPPPSESFVEFSNGNLLDFKSGESHWLKIQSQDLVKLSKPVLIIKPNTIYNFQVFTAQDSRYQLISKQSRFDFNSAPNMTNFYKAVLLEEHKNTSSIYISIQEIHTTRLKLELWELDEYLKVDFKYNSLLTAIFFGILLMVLINLFFYLNINDKAYLYYILYNSSVLFLLMIMTGYIYHFEPFLFIGQSMQSGLILLLSASFFFTLFVRSFLDTHKLTPKLDKVLTVLQYVYISIFLFIPIFENVSFLILATNLVALSSIFYYLILMAVHIRLKNRPAVFFALAFLNLFLFLTLRFLYILDYLPHNFIFAYGATIAVLLEAILFSIGLADRVLQFQIQRDSAQKEFKKTNFIYNLEKDFASLLNRTTDILQSEKPRNLENVVIREFFNQLVERLSFNSSAVLYEKSGQLTILPNSFIKEELYQKLVKDNLSSLCTSSHSEALDVIRFEQSEFIIIPVKMRGHEWCVVILEKGADFVSTSDLESFLHHYSTELIRCLLNAHGLKEIKSKAETDELTGVFNRRAILERFMTLFNLAKASEQQLSIAFIDIDNFKSVNDDFGHAGGDKCLTSLAKIFRRNLTEECRVGRFGGDEFLVIMPNFKAQDAEILIKQMKQSILPLIVHDRLCTYTISIGIASINPDVQDIHELLRLADNALYASKSVGKNSIRLA